MKRAVFIIFVIVLIISCNRCKEECNDPTNPDCPNYVAPDPCADHHEVSAEFLMEAKVELLPVYRPCYGAIWGRNLRLTATNQNYDSYKWIIGSDTIYSNQYEFYFPQSFSGQSYPITLIVSGIPDSVCFPEDDGKDTVTVIVPVISLADNPIHGQYKVAWDSAPTDSFEVGLSFFYDSGTDINHLYTKNFDHQETGDSCDIDVIGFGYNYYGVTTNLSPCDRLRGDFWLNEDGSFEADYQLDVDPTGVINMQPFRARGRRIN